MLNVLLVGVDRGRLRLLILTLLGLALARGGRSRLRYAGRRFDRLLVHLLDLHRLVLLLGLHAGQPLSSIGGNVVLVHALLDRFGVSPPRRGKDLGALLLRSLQTLLGASGGGGLLGGGGGALAGVLVVATSDAG